MILSQVLNARVYDVAIDTPLQKAVNMSNDLNNNIFFKVQCVYNYFGITY